jgi:hypothetical protein
MGVVGRAEAGVGGAEGVVTSLVCRSSAMAIGIGASPGPDRRNHVRALARLGRM